MKVRYLAIVGLALLVAGALVAASYKDILKENLKEKVLDPALLVNKGEPGINHKALEPFVGQFTTTCRAWMKPGEAAVESTGSADHVWVFGGRFLKMTAKGFMGDKPFEGVGYLGYDNVSNEYVSVWLDNMSTGIVYASGQFDTGTQTLNERGTANCPMTGQVNMPFRCEWKIVNSDTIIHTFYHNDADGKEVKGFEATYKRMKTTVEK